MKERQFSLAKKAILAVLAVLLGAAVLFGATQIRGERVGSAEAAAEGSAQTYVETVSGPAASDLDAIERGVVTLSADAPVTTEKSEETSQNEESTDLWWLVITLTAVLGVELIVILIALMKRDKKKAASLAPVWLLAAFVPGGAVAICVVLAILIVGAGVALFLILRKKKAKTEQANVQPRVQPVVPVQPVPVQPVQPVVPVQPVLVPVVPVAAPAPAVVVEPVRTVVVPAPAPMPEPPAEEPVHVEPPHIETMQSVRAAEVDNILEDEIAQTLVEESVRVADRTKTGIINVDTLEKYFEDGETVTLEEIKKRLPGYNKVTYLKVLARGTLDKKLTVEADDYSIEAVKMILLTGGKVLRTRARAN